MQLLPRIRKNHNGERGLELYEFAVGSGIVAIAALISFTPVGEWLGLRPKPPTAEEMFANDIVERMMQHGCMPTEKPVWLECPKDKVKALCREGDKLVARARCGALGSLTIVVPSGKTIKEAEVPTVEPPQRK